METDRAYYVSDFAKKRAYEDRNVTRISDRFVRFCWGEI